MYLVNSSIIDQNVFSSNFRFPNYFFLTLGQDRCYDPLGMQNFRIPDSSITSNAQMRFSTPAIASRLYMKPGNTMDGAWCVNRGTYVSILILDNCHGCYNIIKK